MRLRVMVRVALTLALAGGVLAAAPPAFAATSWTVHDLALPAPGDTVFPSDVSCVSAAMCMAVGDYTSPTSYQTELTELWNGTSWSVLPTPPPVVPGWTYLESVSCPTSTACIAAGATFTPSDDRKHAFALSWDGTSWTNVTLPDVPAAGSTNYDVGRIDCVTPTWCKASARGNELLPFLMSFSNGAWSVDSVPFPPNTFRAAMGKISCYSQSFCVAVGGFQNKAGNNLGLAEEWNGTAWRADSVPVPGNVSGLNSVSCTTARNCTAVGYHANAANTTGNGTVERKNGTFWSSGGVPSAAGYPQSALNDIACSTNSSCIVLGSKSKGSVHVGYAASWNGLSWTFDTLPAGVSLGLMSCPTKTFCMGLGESSPGQVVSATRG